MNTWDVLLAKMRNFDVDHPSGHSDVEKWKRDSFLDDFDQLLNFRRNFLSGGTINPPDRPSFISRDLNYENEKRRTFWFLRLFHRLSKLELHSALRHKHFFKYYPDEQRNNFRRSSLFNNYLLDLPIRVSYYFSNVKHERKLEDESSILEIGGGFGALALLYCRQFPLDTYYLVDLPENLLLAYINLTQGGIPVATIDNVHADFRGVILLTGDEIASVNKADIFVNTMSFQHMNLRNIEFFFSHLFRIQPKKMYFVNRLEKRDPTDISILDYPKNVNYRLKKQNRIFTHKHLEQVWERVDT